MDPFNAELNALLMGTYRSIVKVEEAMLKSLSRERLTIGEMHILEQIGKDGGEGVTITRIAQEIGLTLPSVTVAVKKLEKKGYLTKQKDAADGRVVLVTPTETGRRAEIAHRYFHRQMVRAVSASVPAEERDVLIQAFRNLYEFLSDKAEELARAERD